jgi:uncharacterized protein (TIGR03435 family)
MAPSCILFCAVVIFGQSLLRFDVASIRPSSPGELDGPTGAYTGHGLARMTNVTLKNCIVEAYGVGPDRVHGGPDWIDTERFQITAKADQPLGEDIVRLMLQTLLAERFKLKLHRETRRSETLVLQVAKNGSKLPPAGNEPRSIYNGHGRIEAKTVSMTEFADVLSGELKLPVIDRTKLSGVFNLTVQWNPNSLLAGPDTAAADTRPSLFTAIQQQLGLVLKSQRLPVETLVIDAAERPSDN